LSSADLAAQLAEDIQAYLLHLRVERRLAARTLALYEDAYFRLKQLVMEQGLGGRDVQAHHVRHWISRFNAMKLAPGTIAIQLSAWRGLYRWLGLQGKVKHNPVQGLHAPRKGKPLPKALSVDQAVKLAEHQAEETSALSARDHCIVELLYGCGLRVGELVALDCQLDANSLGWIDQQDALVHVTGKGQKRRSVPVGMPALVALNAWLENRTKWDKKQSSALFISQQGTRLSSSQVRRRLASWALAAGVPTHVHPHMLRHSFASHVLQSSTDLRGVQELLGHANISSTQVYTRLDFGHLSKVYDSAHPRAKKKTPVVS
jgi:integrase/recombinase XerC